MTNRHGYRALIVSLIAAASAACNGNDGQSPGNTMPGDHDASTPTDVAVSVDDDVVTPPIDAGADVVTTIDGHVDAPTTPVGLTCADAMALRDGVAVRGEQTPATGIGATACRPSDAPQRFYTFDIPAGHRATITVDPTGADWTAVARVMVSCDATMCITDGQSDVPGASVTLYVDNPGTEVLHKIITVSGTAPGARGTFDITASLGPVGTDGGTGGDDGGSDGGTMPPPVCAFPTERAFVTPSDQVTGSFALTDTHRLAGACISTNGSERLFPFHLDEPSVVQLAVFTGGSFASVGVSIRRVCDDGATSLGCNRDYDMWGEARLRVNVEPGDYYAILDWNGDRTASSYRLSFETHPSVTNSVCEAPMPVTDGTMLTGVAGTSGGQNEVYCIGDSDAPMPVLYYSASVPAGQTLAVTARATGTVRNRIGVAIIDHCRNPSSTCLSTPPGSYRQPASATFTNSGSTARDVIIAVMNESQFDLGVSIH